MKETNSIKVLTDRVYALIVLTAIVFGLSVIKNFVNEKWARERSQVACIPDIETNYPGVYIQSAAHPINNDAKLQSFIEQYVHLTRNKQVIDFHKLVKEKAGEIGRYDKARLSDSLWKAVFMSKGPEKIVRQKLFSESSDFFRYLDREKMGIVFLIDEIIIMPVPAGQTTSVIVRGQYEQIFDTAEADKKALPPEFLGYKELRYVVETSFPSTDENNNWENKNGFYVIWSDERTLTGSEMYSHQQKSRELLLHGREQK